MKLEDRKAEIGIILPISDLRPPILMYLTYMLSILIPVYQYDVQALVRDLVRQADRLSVAWEIICLDDASDAFWRDRNRSVSELPGVQYREAGVNLGRSRVRNQLVQLANYPFVLFMDCDSGVVRADFLEIYVDALEANRVLCGGRVYRENRPEDEAFTLHWLYGREREEQSAEKRALQPHHAFMTNNFVAPREVLLRFPFEEALTQYGHEDTLFGQQLEDADIPVVHLDNPLEHLGLERSDVFLAKAEQALDNLAFLRKRGTSIDTRLTSTYDDLRSRGFAGLIRWGLSLLKPWFRRNLLSEHPDLRIFDLYRLEHFLEAMRK